MAITPKENIEKRTAWESAIPPEQARCFQRVLSAVRRENIPFALGGGLALSVYTGNLRNKKDMDIYVMPSDRQRTIDMITSCGLKDYYDVMPYDRAWIYRSHEENIIVDTIWAMANQRAVVDEQWIDGGDTIHLFGEEYQVMPPEELIWSKLYVLQRDRCDWPDILNLLHATAPALDWDHLLDRAGEDAPLVKAVLAVFSWVSPETARQIPHWVWDCMGLPVPLQNASNGDSQPRADLLDTRPWFGPDQQLTEP